MDQDMMIEYHPESPACPYAVYDGEDYVESFCTFEAAAKALTEMQAPQKEIVYDKETRDYAAYLDGEYMGSYRSHLLAEQVLDAAILAALKAGQGASDPDERPEAPTECPGVRFPCSNIATREYRTFDGDDAETRRAVSILLCETCFAEATNCDDDGSWPDYWKVRIKGDDNAVND